MFFAPTSIQLLIRIGFTLVFQYIYICLGRVCISIYIRRYYSVLVSLMVIRVLFFSSDVKVSMGIELSTFCCTDSEYMDIQLFIATVV